jgi:plastocyanin
VPARLMRARSIVAVAVLLGVLAACGNDDGGTADATEDADAVTEQADAATDAAGDPTEEADEVTDEAAGDGAASTAGLVVVDFGFEPETLDVEAGATIEVVNEDAVTHTVTAEDGSFDVRLAGGGDRATFTVDDAGSYPFACAIHPSMTGTIVVN